MTKLYFNFGFFLVSICGCFSQITLSEKDFPDALDTVRYSTTTNPNLDYSKSGEKITWDFSDLVATNQFVRAFTSIDFSPVQFTYGAFVPNKHYRASYFIPENTLPLDQLNTILPVSLSDARSYQKSTTDSITKLGYSIKVNGVDVAFKSDTIETKYKFPMDYQQVFSTRGYTFIDLNPAANFKVKQSRNVTSIVDGHGQLILPFGTFEVLRLKRDIIEMDSVYQSFFGLPLWIGIPPIQTTEYEWIGKDKNDVLLKVVVNTANGSNLIQSIEYQDVYRNLSVSVNEVDDHFIIYPSMVEETLSLRSNSEITKYEISDMNGKTELIGDIDGTLGSVNVTSLKSGFYFIRVNTALGYSTSRFFKQ